MSSENTKEMPSRRVVRRVCVYVPDGLKALAAAAAGLHGVSLSVYVVAAVREALKRDAEGLKALEERGALVAHEEKDK
jgi:predicted HicB family RNase H-like nuclease